MKLTALACFILLSVAVKAQQTPEAVSKPFVPKKNDIGVFAETAFDNNKGLANMNFHGLQYKHWVKPNMAYKIIAAYGPYHEINDNLPLTKIGDTTREAYKATLIYNEVLGAGIEMQRRFYKNVYLYAAVELRGSYGKGSYFYDVSKSIEDTSANYYHTSYTTPDRRATMFSISATPSIGAKIQFKRWGFGTELSAVQLSVTNIKFTDPLTAYEDVGISELTAGAFRQRFFAYFRF